MVNCETNVTTKDLYSAACRGRNEVICYYIHIAKLKCNCLVQFKDGVHSKTETSIRVSYK